MIKIKIHYILIFTFVTFINVNANESLVFSTQGDEKINFIQSENPDSVIEYQSSEAIDWIFPIAGTNDVMALASSLNRLFIFNRMTGERKNSLPVCDIPKSSAKFRNSIEVWVSCGLANQVRAYYLPNFDLADIVQLNASPNHLTLSTLHNKVLASFDNSRQIAIINSETKSLEFNLSMPSFVGQVFYSHDEKSIWVSLPDINQVRELNAINYGLISEYDTGEQMESFAVSPDNRWIAISHHSESTLWLHDRTNDSIQLIEFNHELSQPSFTSDSQTLFIALPNDDEILKLNVLDTQISERITVSHIPNSRGQITYREDPFLIFTDNFEGE